MKLSVVGLGKLGSPLAILLAKKKHKVKGIDLSETIVRSLNERKTPFHEPQLQELLDDKSLDFEASTQYESAIYETDVTFVIVPTPSQTNGLFTNEYVLDAVENIGKVLKKKSSYHLVVVTSTVMPGSTNGKIREVLEQSSGRRLGPTLGLCYNPEFIALGSVVHDMLHPDMVLIGESDEKAGKMLEEIYLSFCENHPPVKRMNCINAELAKLSLNTFVTTKISYANMLAAVCDRLSGSDVDVVTQAIGLDSRIGQKYLKASVAFGGPCFPRDNVAFRSMANELNVAVDLADATQKINDSQTERLHAIIKRYAKSPRVGILGLSYKPGTYVVEESPGVKVANQLAQNGYEVTVYDPMALSEAKHILNEAVHLSSSIEECLSASETGIIMTNWPEFAQEITLDLMKQIGRCKCLIDCWRTVDQHRFDDVCQVIYLGQGKMELSKTNEELLTI